MPWRRPTLSLLLVLAAAAWPAHAQDPLPPAVVAALAAAQLPADALAAVALPLGRWQRAWRFGAERAMQPASTMKLVTAIVALDRLGPTQRGFTALRSAAPVDSGGVLQGDLVLQGGGDPELDLPAFWQLLVELREQGVVEIAGDLLVDRTLWQPARPDLVLPAFDTTPEFPYNVVPDALQLAGNLLTLELQADADGPVRVRSLPSLPEIDLRSEQSLNDRSCKDWADDWQPARLSREGGRTVVTLRGAFPRGCSQRAALQLIDRQQLTEQLFRKLWQGLGGRWRGQAREAAAPPGTRLLARHQARPWAEVLRGLMKQSDNPQARMLFAALGVVAEHAEQAEQAAKGEHAAPTAADGLRRPTAEWAAIAVRRWLAAHGIDARGLVLDNGSGLSRSERISPAQLAGMLKAAHAGRHAADLLASLPLAGVDGTLRDRLKNSPASGWARLKTGTLRNVAALAGYIDDAHGQRWAVAMMINHEQAGRGRPVLDALVDAIASDGPHGRPSPAGDAWP